MKRYFIPMVYLMSGDMTLSSREREIAELLAWGASKKEIAKQLFLSVRTVENHARAIYEKTGCKKSNQLSAWWFCTHYHISFDLSPLKRTLISLFFLAILMPSIYTHDNSMLRTQRTRTTRTVNVRGGRRRYEGD